jgi:drug/metabolite transporter superfamily protein YnfA
VLEIVGCYLPWLVLKQGRPVWLLLPAALALLAWLHLVDGVALVGMAIIALQPAAPA